MKDYKRQTVDVLNNFKKVWCEKEEGTYTEKESPFRCSECRFKISPRKCILNQFISELYEKVMLENR